LAIPETTVNRINVDDSAAITFPTLPDEPANGRITYIGSAAVKANAFPVKVELIDPNEKVKPGMTAEAGFSIKDENRQPGYLVPLQALLPVAVQLRALGLDIGRSLPVQPVECGDYAALINVTHG